MMPPASGNKFQSRTRTKLTTKSIFVRQLVLSGRRPDRWRGILGLIISGIQLLNTKPVYQGEFQIVLSQENSQMGNPVLRTLA